MRKEQIHTEKWSKQVHLPQSKSAIVLINTFDFAVVDDTLNKAKLYNYHRKCLLLSYAKEK